jgi:hypothetical protein
VLHSHVPRSRNALSFVASAQVQLTEKKAEWDATFEKSKADWAADTAQQVAAAKASAAESGAALQAQLNSALQTAVRAHALSRMHAAFPQC